MTFRFLYLCFSVAFAPIVLCVVKRLRALSHDAGTMFYRFWGPGLVRFVFPYYFSAQHSTQFQSCQGCAHCCCGTFRHSIARRLCETHPVFQLQGMLGFFVRWHRVLLFKVWSNYTLLHHLGTTQNESSNPAANHRAPLTPHKSETKRPKSGGERRLRCYWICSPSHNCGVHYSFCNTGFKRGGKKNQSLIYLILDLLFL